MSARPPRSIDEMVAAGVPREVAEQCHAENAETDRILDAGLCPKCGQPGPVADLDPRQYGSGSDGEGVWVNYRHTCGFLLDRYEDPPPSTPN